MATRIFLELSFFNICMNGLAQTLSSCISACTTDGLYENFPTLSATLQESFIAGHTQAQLSGQLARFGNEDMAFQELNRGKQKLGTRDAPVKALIYWRLTRRPMEWVQCGSKQTGDLHKEKLLNKERYQVNGDRMKDRGGRAMSCAHDLKNFSALFCCFLCLKLDDCAMKQKSCDT